MKLREEIKILPPYPAGKAKQGFLKLSSNENPIGTSPKALKALEGALKEIPVYQDGRSTLLSKAIGEAYGLSLENVVVGNGSDEIFSLACNAYGGQGRHIIGSANTFSEYRFSAIVCGSSYQEIPTSEGRYDLGAFEKAIKDDTAILFLCSPNNPTGMIIPGSQLLPFLRKVPSTVLVILDQAYGEYVEDSDYPGPKELIQEFSNVLVTRTFSKIYGLASLRLGYGLAHPNIIQDLLRVKQPFNVNRLAQEAGLGALEDKEFLALSLETNRKEKKRLEEFLDDLGANYFPSEGNFLCIKVPETGAKAFELIAKEGILIRDLASFGLPEHIRVTVGTEDQNGKLIAALKKLFSKG